MLYGFSDVQVWNRILEELQKIAAIKKNGFLIEEKDFYR